MPQSEMTLKQNDGWSQSGGNMQSSQKEQSISFSEDWFASDSQSGSTVLPTNASNPYAAALADVFGL